MTAVLFVLLAAGPGQDLEAAPVLAPWVPRLDLQEPTEDRPGETPESRTPATRTRDRSDPLQTLVRIISHPFVDNGRRFDAYPYASGGAYYSTRGFSDKMYAFELSSTFGRIEHDLLSVGTETKFSWSSGCDVRIDFLVLEEVVDGRRFDTQLGHVHLDFGGYEGPRTVDWSVGIGVGSFDDEETSDFGPSVRAGFRAFPYRPWSFRLDAVYTWFDSPVIDFRGEVGLHFGPLAMTGGVRAVVLSGADDFVGPTVGLAFFF